MKKIVLLSSDTPHHRYFINRLLEANLPIEACFFENVQHNPLFETGPVFELEEKTFEEINFFQSLSPTIPKDLSFNISEVNDKRAKEKIKEINPDFGVVFGTGFIKQTTISLFKDGLINVHRGIAQKYRGLDSDLWALYHRDYNNLGVSIHRVDNELDTGELLRQEYLKPKLGMKTSHIRYHTTVIATDLIIDCLEDYLENKLYSKAQKSKGRYYSSMPLVLKKIVDKQFNEYCMSLR